MITSGHLTLRFVSEKNIFEILLLFIFLKVRTALITNTKNIPAVKETNFKKEVYLK